MNSIEICCNCNGYKSGAINMDSAFQMKLCCCNAQYCVPSENVGWVCPRCQKSNAPFVKECDCHKQCSPGITYFPIYPTMLPIPYFPYNPYLPVSPWPFNPYNPYNPFDTSPLPLFPIYCNPTITTC